MKCPKCHYLSFDPEPRCRNCGYTLMLAEDLSLARESDDAPLADLELKPTDSEVAIPPARRPTPVAGTRNQRVPADSRTDDLFLSRSPEVSSASEFPSETPSNAPPRAEAASTGSGGAPARSTLESAPERREARETRGVTPPSASPVRAPRPPARPAPPTGELPLFLKGTASANDGGATTSPSRDEPPAPPAAAPRPPTAASAPPVPPPVAPVRHERAIEREVPPISRPPARETPKLGPLDRDLLDGLQRIERLEQGEASAASQRARLENAPGAMKRAGAALFDTALFAGIAAGLLWVTLRWCDLSWSDIRVIPLVPFSLFVLLLATGYLVLFTAVSGQTIGKMLSGIRVVDASEDGTGGDPVTVRQAVYRGVVTVPSVLLLGAGFAPALFGDERAFHDRLAQTRVVRT